MLCYSRINYLQVVVLFYFKIIFSKILVQLIGGNVSSEGNVVAFNPETGILGPICDDSWNLKGVSFEIFRILFQIMPCFQLFKRIWFKLTVFF